MRQRNKLDYHAKTNRYNFATLHPTNLKSLSFCSVYSLMYWAKRNNQPEVVKSYPNASLGKYYNRYIGHLLFIAS